MQGLFKYIGTPLALLILAGGMQYGLRVEKSMNVGSYYRELGASPQHLGRVERALFSVLLAASDRLQKHKRQTHAGLPSVTASVLNG